MSKLERLKAAYDAANAAYAIEYYYAAKAVYAKEVEATYAAYLDELEKTQGDRCAECDCANGGDECNWINSKGVRT
jgi:hypothetical protein